MTEVERPAGRALVLTVLRRFTDSYGPGVGGTCYQCPFASEPLEKDGQVAAWNTISNDPTETYFRCFLPGRMPDVEWGEYAPCTEKEWAQAALNEFEKEGEEMARELMSVRLDDDVLKAVDVAAESTGLTRTDVVTRILRRALCLPDADALDTYLDTLAARGSE